MATSFDNYTDLQSASPMRLSELLAVLSRGKWLILGFTFISVVSGALLSWLMTPIYRVEVLLAPAASSSQSTLSTLAGELGPLAGLAGLSVGTPVSDTDQAVAILGSYAFTEKFVQDHDLLPVLFADQWDSARTAWIATDPEEQPTTAKGVEYFRENVRFISEDPDTGFVTLAIEWHDREQAVAWAQDLVSRINATMRERAISEARRSLDYLQKAAKSTTSVELQQAIFSVMEAQLKEEMLASVRDEYAFKVLDPPALPDPDDIYSPKRLLIIAAAAVFGFLLPAAFLLLRHHLARETSR